MFKFFSSKGASNVASRDWLPRVHITIPWWVWLIGMVAILVFVIWCLRSEPDPDRMSLKNIIRYILGTWARDAQSVVSGSRSSRSSRHQEEDNLFSRPSSSSSSTSTLERCSQGERICREFMESKYGVPFHKIRPDFLRNPVTGENLEIDIYNEDLRLGVEYNGQQHYRFNRHFHRGSNHIFQNQQYRDLIKEQKCKEHGIRLIIVPYTVKPQDIPDFLEEQLQDIYPERRKEDEY